MKKALFIVLSALLLSSCAKTASENSSDSSFEPAAPSSEATGAETSVSAEEEPQTAIDLDTSISFENFEQLSASDELYSRIKNMGGRLEKLSEPEHIDDSLYQDGNITMYDGCCYINYKDSNTDTVITVCLCFDQVNDYEGMTAFFDDLIEQTQTDKSSFEYDPEKQVVVNTGNHTSLYRVSSDGLLYCIFSEAVTDDELLSYLDKIRM